MKRKRLVISALAAAAAFVASEPARAFDGYWSCRHVEGYCDPYAYRYEPRGYYPYYNSGQWRPAWSHRRPPYDQVAPPYYQAWGYHPQRYAYARPWRPRHRPRRRHRGW